MILSYYNMFWHLFFLFFIREIYLLAGVSSLSLWHGDGKAQCDLITHTHTKNTLYTRSKLTMLRHNIPVEKNALMTSTTHQDSSINMPSDANFACWRTKWVICMCCVCKVWPRRNRPIFWLNFGELGLLWHQDKNALQTIRCLMHIYIYIYIYIYKTR